MVLSSAAAKVFAIPELLEPILLFSALPSPPLSLKAVKRKVSNEKSPIKTSKKGSGNGNIDAFYQKRFGSPNPPKDLIDCYESSKGVRFLLTSALVVNKFWNSVINDSAAIQEVLFFNWRGIVYPKEKPTFNPLLVSTFTWGYFHDRLPLSEERDRKIRKSIIYKNASWRKMLPVVPPIREVKVHQEELTSYWDYDRGGTIPLEKDFLYMGLLFDLVEEATEPGDSSIFSLTWSGSIDMTAQAPDIQYV